MSPRQGEKQLRVLQPLPARQAEKQVCGVQERLETPGFRDKK